MLEALLGLVMATFPYNPTRILSSPYSDNVIYILQPALSSSSKPQLLSLNISRTIGPTNLPYSTISPTLPFFAGPQEDAYTPAIDDRGNILVYTGNCSDAAEGSTLWRFAPEDNSSGINGIWEEMDLSSSAVGTSSASDGANFLASAIAFSSAANATPEMYIFGGMCPHSTNSTPSDWIQAANYSNTMLTVQSTGSSAVSYYNLGFSSSRGPPIPEAGFTITPLRPTFFDSGSNHGNQSQNQNFVLLGGHTQQAFINMSQVALFSLPEQSWSFLPIDSPSDGPKTDLATRDLTSVDSRSGHTALLTSDGKRVIVFGGWVGDVTNSADPQLAILEVGEGYGGSGDWQWSIPRQTGPGLADGTGLYGHGAALLPGDVMMVLGGYQIPASNGSRRKRASEAVSSNALYFNITSNSWSPSYTHPNASTSHRNSFGSDAGTVAKKAGLGAGLTLGILAIIIVIIVYLWYSRRLKRRRDARDDELRNLAASVHGFSLSGHSPSNAQRPQSEMSAIDFAGNSQTSRAPSPWPLGNVGPSLNRSGRGESEAERTGLLFEIPSPTRGLRRSLHSRGMHQAAPRYDDGRRTPGFNTIHPIDERDEYEEGIIGGPNSGHHELMQTDDYNILSNVPVLDPFRTPVDGSRTPSPQSPQDRELEIRNWVSDWTAADQLMHSQGGRLSPEKNDRTSSTLSDQSARSGFSNCSIQPSTGTISRSTSQRSAALFSATPFRSTNDVTPSDYPQSMKQGYRPDHQRSRSLTLNSGPQRTATSDSFTTTASSFHRLQLEGEALLGDYPGSGEPSPTRSHSRARGWMGSVRRAFTGVDRSASTSPENNASTSSSPTKANYTETGLPRRAASTGAMLWQKRQGARDWDVEGGGQKRGRSGATAQEGNDEEWDVESAVERRVVQVMFTVPKERLRVVNNGPDGDGESILSAEVHEAGVDGARADRWKGKEKE